MELENLYRLFKECSSVSIDTRTIEQNAMFFSIKGENFDGNKFAINALQKGAKYAIVSDPTIKHEKCIYVNDTLIALQSLANYHRKQLSNTTFIALTGSNGKTTTKELIAHFLSQQFEVQFTKGNYNNHLGVPLTLLTIIEETEIAVIEMGANHLFEIKELCEIAEPDCGLITNIGKAHIGEFGGQENIFKAKTELYDFLKSKDRMIFYNSESEYLRSAINKYAYKKSYQECIRNVGFKLLGFKPKISCEISGTQVQLDIGGIHNVQNLQCALTVAYHFGLDPKNIIKGIASFKAPENRSQWHETKRNNVYLDAYNSNPNSMEAAVNYIGALQEEDKVALLGEMLELGEFSNEEHSKLHSILKEKKMEYYLIGASFLHIEDPNIYSSIDDFVAKIDLASWKGKTILLKGSRGMKMEQLLLNL